MDELDGGRAEQLGAGAARHLQVGVVDVEHPAGVVEDHAGHRRPLERSLVDRWMDGLVLVAVGREETIQQGEAFEIVIA